MQLELLILLQVFIISCETCPPAFVDGQKALEPEDGELTAGKVGLTANIPAHFQDFRVTAGHAAIRAIQERIRARNDELERLARREPRARRCGRSSRGRASARDATRASATSTATARWRCSWRSLV
jgi:hypothetical protein